MRSNFPKIGGKAVDYEAVKRNAYHDKHIAIIDLADSRIPWLDRELLIGMCERIYGKQHDAVAPACPSARRAEA